MSRTTLLIGLLLGPPLAFAAATQPAAPATLSAAAIVDRNIAARGGLSAWRAVSTLSWSGKMDAGGNNQPPIQGLPGQPRRAALRVSQPKDDTATLPPAQQAAAEQLQLPFRLELQRPRKSRLEIDFNGETAAQVYDGTQGWKLRPFLNRHEVENFTKDELQAFDVQADLDGALVDYAAKGTKIEVEGMEPVEGQPAYKLRLTLRNDHVFHEWVDAKSFLEVRIEGTPRRLDRKSHPTWIDLRDYRNDNGLMIPHLLETRVQGVKQTEKIRIEKVMVNPPLAPARFSKPT